MAFNPLAERGLPLERQLRNWSELNSKPYDTRSVHPYTRCRVILMNGIETEAILFSHNFNRNCADVELKQRLQMVRRVEHQQQRAVNWLIPGEAQENVLEVTIGYEQVAGDRDRPPHPPAVGAAPEHGDRAPAHSGPGAGGDQGRRRGPAAWSGL